MDDDIDDLLGSSEPEVEIETEHARGGVSTRESLTERGASLALRGVTPGWFAAILGIGRTTVNRKISHIAPKATGTNNAKLYDVRECLPYLVQPHDLKRHLMRMDPKDLPERLRKEFWSARIAEQRARQNAKDLWRSEAVLALYGEFFKTVKDTAILWADQIHKEAALSDEQFEALDRHVTDLLTLIGDNVKELMSGRESTFSQEDEFTEELVDADA